VGNSQHNHQDCGSGTSQEDLLVDRIADIWGTRTPFSMAGAVVLITIAGWAANRALLGRRA
jgi:hypothetical protein